MPHGGVFVEVRGMRKVKRGDVLALAAVTPLLLATPHFLTTWWGWDVSPSMLAVFGVTIAAGAWYEFLMGRR